jgi:hypothetical protein
MSKFLHGSSISTKFSLANNLAKREWPQDPMCQLCNVAPEMPTNLCLECSFTQNVWTYLTSQLGRQDMQAAAPSHTISGWCKRMRQSFNKMQKPTFDGLMLYFWYGGIFGRNTTEGFSNATP